jgi:hypothetical protein
MLAIVDLRILWSVGTFTNANSFSIFFTIFLTNTYHMEAESLRTRVGVKSGDCSINWLNSIVCWMCVNDFLKQTLFMRIVSAG